MSFGTNISNEVETLKNQKKEVKDEETWLEEVPENISQNYDVE